MLPVYADIEFDILWCCTPQLFKGISSDMFLSGASEGKVQASIFLSSKNRNETLIYTEKNNVDQQVQNFTNILLDEGEVIKVKRI